MQPRPSRLVLAARTGRQTAAIYHEQFNMRAGIARAGVTALYGWIAFQRQKPAGAKFTNP